MNNNIYNNNKQSNNNMNLEVKIPIYINPFKYSIDSGY